MNPDRKVLAAAAVGAVIGIAIALFGFWKAVMILAMTGGGWLAGLYITDQLPAVDEYLGRFFDKRRNRG